MFDGGSVLRAKAKCPSDFALQTRRQGDVDLNPALCVLGRPDGSKRLLVDQPLLRLARGCRWLPDPLAKRTWLCDTDDVFWRICSPGLPRASLAGAAEPPL